MPGAIRIGSFVGAPVWLTPAALVALPAIVVPTAIRDPTAAVVLMVALFCSILGHEMGHALAARRLGYCVYGIFHVGVAGLCTLDLPPARRTWARCLIATAGPFANFLIAIVLLPLATLTSGQTRIHAVVVAVIFVNLVLFIGNLLPVFPLDGSYLATELLATRTSRSGAIFVTAACGTILSVPLLAFGFVSTIIGYPVVVAAMPRLNWKVLREAWSDLK